MPRCQAQLCMLRSLEGMLCWSLMAQGALGIGHRGFLMEAAAKGLTEPDHGGDKEGLIWVVCCACSSAHMCGLICMCLRVYICIYLGMCS